MSSRWLAWIPRRHELILSRTKTCSSCWHPKGIGTLWLAQTSEDECEHLVADTQRILPPGATDR